MAVPSDWAGIKEAGLEVIGPHVHTFAHTEEYDPFVDEDDLLAFHRNLLLDSSGGENPLNTAGERSTYGMQGVASTAYLERLHDTRLGPENQGELFLQEEYTEHRPDISRANGQYSREMAGAAHRKLTQIEADGSIGQTPDTMTDFIKRRNIAAGYGERLLRDDIAQRTGIISGAQPRRMQGAASTYLAPLTSSLGVGVDDEETFQHGPLSTATGNKYGYSSTLDGDILESTDYIDGAHILAPRSHMSTFAQYQSSQDWGDTVQQRNLAMADTLHRAVQSMTLIDAPDELGVHMLNAAQAGIHPSQRRHDAWKNTKLGETLPDGHITNPSKNGASLLALRGKTLRASALSTPLDNTAHLASAMEMMFQARSADFTAPHAQRGRMFSASKQAGDTLVPQFDHIVDLQSGVVLPSAAAFAAVRTCLDERTLLSNRGVVNYSGFAPAPQTPAGIMQREDASHPIMKISERDGLQGIHPSNKLYNARENIHASQRDVLHANASSRAGGGVYADHSRSRDVGFAAANASIHVSDQLLTDSRVLI